MHVKQRRDSQRTRRTTGSLRRHGVFAPLFAALVIVLGCNYASPTTLPTADPLALAELDRSISIRVANGLRADPTWVAEVIANPQSVVRWTVYVTPLEAHDIDEREIADAIEFRHSVGMLADESWVRSLQFDPAAVIRNGIPMSAQEAAEFDGRIRVQLDVGPAIVGYGEQHPDEWAGVWIDPVTSQIIARFTDHLDEHRQAILALFAPGVASVDVRDARWSTKELDALSAPIWTPENLHWLEQLGVKVLGGGSRVIENDVSIAVAVPAPKPNVAKEIIDRFHGEGWLTVDVKVDPSMNLDFGALRVTVVDSQGRPVQGVACEITGDVSGAGGDDVVHEANADGVCFWEHTHATRYRVDVWMRFREDLLGSARVEVPAHGIGRVTIAVEGS